MKNTKKKSGTIKVSMDEVNRAFSRKWAAGMRKEQAALAKLRKKDPHTAAKVAMGSELALATLRDGEAFLMVLSHSKVAKVFTKWEAAYRKNPEGFMSEAVKLLKYTPETYGDRCAAYFLHLLKEGK